MNATRAITTASKKNVIDLLIPAVVFNRAKTFQENVFIFLNALRKLGPLLTMQSQASIITLQSQVQGTYEVPCTLT